jgi:hypothetical protein
VQNQAENWLSSGPLGKCRACASNWPRPLAHLSQQCCVTSAVDRTLWNNVFGEYLSECKPRAGQSVEEWCRARDSQQRAYVRTIHFVVVTQDTAPRACTNVETCRHHSTVPMIVRWCVYITTLSGALNSVEWWLMNNELERIWKEAIVA